jgi:hypothetical protein
VARAKEALEGGGVAGDTPDASARAAAASKEAALVPKENGAAAAAGTAAAGGPKSNVIGEAGDWEMAPAVALRCGENGFAVFTPLLPTLKLAAPNACVTASAAAAAVEGDASTKANEAAAVVVAVDVMVAATPAAKGFGVGAKGAAADESTGAATVGDAMASD